MKRIVDYISESNEINKMLFASVVKVRINIGLLINGILNASHLSPGAIRSSTLDFVIVVPEGT